MRYEHSMSISHIHVCLYNKRVGQAGFLNLIMATYLGVREEDFRIQTRPVLKQ